MTESSGFSYFLSSTVLPLTAPGLPVCSLLPLRGGRTGDGGSLLKKRADQVDGWKNG